MSKPILPVDDSKTMREMVTFTLKEAGFTTLEAADGKEALSVLAAQNGSISGIITDLNMPNMNGIELIKTVPSDPKHKFLPILMLTTESDDSRK